MANTRDVVFESDYSPLKVSMQVTKRNGERVPFDDAKVIETFIRAARGFEKDIDQRLLCDEVVRNIFNDISTSDLEKSCILAATAFIEYDPAYSKVAARVLHQKICKEVTGTKSGLSEKMYRRIFIDNITQGVEKGLLNKRMLEYDLDALAAALIPARDDLFEYMGLHQLYERYLLKERNKSLELPQTFWMRIAMGLALAEKDMTAYAIEFYEVLSTFRFISSTPTLFHAGLPVAQLSSCYLTTVSDDLSHIFKCVSDSAQLSKWAGGIGTDWTNVRATGSSIKSIKATSQGIVPFLKIYNDLVVAISKTGIRRGGVCVYLEVWHLDVEEFLDLRRNTGDDRRRTHDMNTAAWVPDLFMKRVLEEKDWTLFSPNETPDLHALYGKAFEEKYIEYERMAQEGKIEQYKVLPAKQLWRKMLSRLFETGHPWITFKDPSNIRSPQDHIGVINSSNLCTEIILPTSEDETAVCNLGSINLTHHFHEEKLDNELLQSTVKTAIRMLDNVIDLNFYPTKEAERSNMRHRPIGLGLMGFQDALFKMNLPFDSDEAIEFADATGEKISYYAIETSCELAQEKGAYATFKGSKWDRGIFPFDTLDLLEKERGIKLDVSRTIRLDWQSLKNKVKKHGMRNSNTMAIAPTATISSIVNCFPCIEPAYKNIYVKANVAGEFTVVNHYLIQDLKKIGLWNQQMLELLKYYDGEVSKISIIPEHLRKKYKTAFELDPEQLIKLTAVRGKWIDQSQSHNFFLRTVSGKKLHDTYVAAWLAGLKTTYYARTESASKVEKSTLDAKTYGFTQKREYKELTPEEFEQANQINGLSCDMDEACTSCQ